MQANQATTASVSSSLTDEDIVAFHLVRCDRVVSAVMRRISAGS
jgi:hypothetical protein